MSDPAKDHAKEKWSELNAELDALRKLLESPDERKKWNYDKWAKLKSRLVDLKYDGMKDIPGPYGTKLKDWYQRLYEVDLFLDEMDEKFRTLGDSASFDWDEVLSRLKDAKKAKDQLEKFLE